MQLSAGLLILCAALVAPTPTTAAANAAQPPRQLWPPQLPQQRVVPFRIRRQPGVYYGSHSVSIRHRRGLLGHRAPVDEELANNRTLGAYFADVEVGTPGQVLTLHVDTGSTDVWLLADDADLCTSSSLQSLYGKCMDVFDRTASSTFESLSTGEFRIQYLDGSGASGDFFLDHVNVGGLNVSGVQMGLARKSTSMWGMMGIGYNTNGVDDEVYPSLIDQMHSQGLINVKAYSLYLNDLEASTGTILFGGIDTEKFTGTLKSVPSLPDAGRGGQITHFNVSLTSLSTVSDVSGISSSFVDEENPVPVILDSGTTFTYLPRAVTGKLFAQLNAYDGSVELLSTVFVDCTLRDTDPNLFIRYQFGGPEGPAVNVSIADIVFDDLKPYIAAGLITLPSNLPFPRENACSLGILTSDSDNVHLLGDTFLRSAYVVYDLTNDQVGLAQSNMNATTRENIVELQAGTTAIPELTGQPAVVPTGVPVARKKSSAAAAGRVPRVGMTVAVGLVGSVVWLGSHTL